MHHHFARNGQRALAAAVALVCAALLCTALAATAQAKTSKPTTHKTTTTKITPSTPVTPGSGYLALGDSVSFGYMESTVVPTPDYADAASFDGYPEMLGSGLRLKVANLACPGETSSSLINPSAASNGCENAPSPTSPAYRKLFPLHVKYTGSQLSEAVKYLKSHSGVRLVSLMIGANDFYVCEETTADQCTSLSEQVALLQKVEKNVHTIVGTIRTKAHYNGQIALVNYYSLDYASAAQNLLSKTLDQYMDRGADGYHVRIANGYKAFELAAAHSGDDPCTAGLLTQLSTGGCGIHPSTAGQALLASALQQTIKLS
jgi:lysophospholipase L1-like esterase